MNYKTRNERLVVIGGCAAGMSAASKAKRLNPNLEVIALERTPHVSYSACGIPYYVADLVREPDELISVTAGEFKKKRNIEVLIRHEVKEINRARKKVIALELNSGHEVEFNYDKLLLSVGGLPRKPEVPGIGLQNVFTVQTLQDGIAIRKFMDQQHPKQVIVVGGGYIAMEMTDAFLERGLKVTLVEKEARILPAFEAEVSEIVQIELVKRGVEVFTSTEILSIDGNSMSQVTGLTLADQTHLSADFVLVCTGLAPNTKLAEAIGLRTGFHGGIIVDQKQQTSTANIYAAGDCVEVRNLVSGKPDYIPLGPTANRQGRVAGENIGGGHANFKGVVGTSVFKVFNLEVARTGLSREQAGSYGFHAGTVTIENTSRAGYYPGAKSVTVAVIFDKTSGKLLGAQLVGEDGISKRVDVFATALINRMTLDEMGHLDLSYAPPFAPVWDPVLVAVNVARQKLRK